MSLSKRIIVGKVCGTWDIVTILRKTSTVSAIYEKLSDIAYELGGTSDFVNPLNRQILLEMVTFPTALRKVLDDWVSRKSEKAELDCLLTALKNLQLNEGHDALAAAFSEEKSNPICRFVKPIPAIEFFSKRSTSATGPMLVVATPDVPITCQKIKESIKNSQSVTFESFLNLQFSSENDHSTLRYVVVNKLQELKKLPFKCKRENCKILVVVDIKTAKEYEEQLEKNASLKDLVGIITDEMKWEELSFGFQWTLQQTIQEELNIEIEEESLAEILHGQTLVDAINGKKPKLYKETLPEKLPYYVSRTLRSRNIISKKILEKSSTQVFLFSGLTRPELSNLVKKVVTDNSTNTLATKKITSRFIVLDSPRHFTKITKLINEPIHWLNWLPVAGDGTLQWVQSIGDMRVLRSFVTQESEQICLREDYFFEMIHLASNSPICIVDSPGMGKTVLLAEIGRQLAMECPQKDILFISMAELVKRVLKVRECNTDISSAIVQAMQDLTCETYWGKLNLQKKLNVNKEKKMGHVVEALLDGLDEVDTVDYKLAEQILQIMLSFTTVRIWVTSRPHLLDQIETILSTLGYKILPFSEDDQINFLTNCWTTQSMHQREIKQLGDFAKNCLRTLHSKLDTAEAEIAGVPMQCFIIGEIYREQAENYVGNDSVPHPGIELNSIADLYQSLINTKLRKYRVIAGDTAQSDEEMIEMHQKLSLNLLFPGHNVLLNVKVKTKEILKMGIVQSESALGHPRFLHRTIAEYFVALLVADGLMRGTKWNKEFSKILFAGVLEVKTIKDLTFLDFTQFAMVAPHFLNSMIIKLPVTVREVLLPRYAKDFMDFEKLKRWIDSALFSSYLQLFELLVNLCIRVFPSNTKMLFTANRLKRAAEQPNLEIFKLTLSKFKRCREFDLITKMEVVRTAVLYGNLSITEFLINECGLRSVFGKFRYHDGNTLMHYCVEFLFSFEKEKNVAQKIEILHLLYGIDATLLEAENDENETPLLLPYVNPNIVLELIKLGADTSRRTEDGSTVLHNLLSVHKPTVEQWLKIVKSVVERQCDVYAKNSYQETFLHLMLKTLTLTPNQFRELAEYLVEKGYANLFHTIGGLLKSSVFQEAIYRIDVEESTVTFLHSHGVDINGVSLEGWNSLSYAIMGGRSLNLVSHLIDLGADAKCVNRSGWNLLHCVAFYGKEVDIIELSKLLLNKGVSLNEVNKYGKTPLMIAAKRGRNVEFLKYLIKEGTDWKKVNRNNSTILSITAEYGTPEALEYFVQLDDVNVNAVDDDGDTALHCAMRSEVEIIEKTKLLLSYGADASICNKAGYVPFTLAKQRLYAHSFPLSDIAIEELKKLLTGK